MNILVTGGAGFIGSNLCEAILGLGYRVRCLDDLSTGKQKNVDMFADDPDYEFFKLIEPFFYNSSNTAPEKKDGLKVFPPNSEFAG